MEVPLQGPFEESGIMQHNKNNQGVISSHPVQKNFLLMEHSKEELQHVKMDRKKTQCYEIWKMAWSLINPLMVHTLPPTNLSAQLSDSK